MTRGAGALFAILGLAGCAGSHTAPASAGAVTTTADASEELESLEQRISEDETAIASLALDCDGACRAASSICDCAARICEIAAELADRDSVSRCHRAEATCDDSRERLADRCTCPGS